MLYGLKVRFVNVEETKCLNPYFFGKCSTAKLGTERAIKMSLSLNPYFFGKCSTAISKNELSRTQSYCLNPYFFGKCSTAVMAVNLDN